MVSSQDCCTKARLLRAGRKVFAEHGLKKATVQEICELAKANGASVNYHFGSKEKLYVSVLEDYFKEAERRHPRDLGITPESTPEERLRAFINGFLLQTLGDGDPVDERLGKRFKQELIEPSEPFVDFLNNHCRPSFDHLTGIVRELLPGLDETDAVRCASSILGQCVHLDFAREAKLRMTPELVLMASNIESLTDFIMEFSLGGIERLRRVRSL
jgi:TetR/AcrR family transcriptional regulator, regulator of cefoperazone and chloramphenicol sensitivity